jgi:hypothetical protein
MAPSARLNAFDIKIGIPYLLLSFELAIIAILHLYAFPFESYRGESGAPVSLVDMNGPPLIAAPRQGGFLGFRAMVDAMNPWDFFKSLGRSIRWLVLGRKRREEDPSYKLPYLEMDLQTYEEDNSITEERRWKAGGLPIAEEFRRSKFGILPVADESPGLGSENMYDERVPMIEGFWRGRFKNAQNIIDERSQVPPFHHHDEDHWEADLANARGYAL